MALWRQWLAADDLLSPGLREGYRRTLEGFEGFCLKRAAGQAPAAGGGAAARPTVGLAREYVELQRLERAKGNNEHRTLTIQHRTLNQGSRNGKRRSTGCSGADAASGARR